jgi:hypothetical protein
MAEAMPYTKPTLQSSASGKAWLCKGTPPAAGRQTQFSKIAIVGFREGMA